LPGSTCVLYTKLGTGVEQGPMSTTALRNIAIDHVFPMKIILEEQEANLPALKRITQAFITSKLWQDHGKLKVKMIKDIGNDLLNKDLFNQTDIPALKEELEHIQRFIELQLMDANANLLKKAKFERNEEKKSPIS
jgi:division protein CdvB (Snf7/Vps24/ESCRT-III family)